ncbi:MAG: sulfatase-like hydrolase/transferase [Vicinamibacteria bacterium]
MKDLFVAAFAACYWNVLFTFENLPSTPSIRWAPKLSVEILILVFALAAVKSFGWRLSRAARGGLALLILLATLVRYVDVTALGVLGREFDLYGDFPHLHRVLAMFLEVMTPKLGVLVAGVVALSTALALSLNWAGLGALDRVLERVRSRRVVEAVAFTAILVFFVFPGEAFSPTVTSIVERQIGNLLEGESTRRSEAAIDFPPQSLDSNLEKLGNANVFLIFVESYGITLFEDARHYDALAPRFRELERSLGEAGYFFSSGQIQSPTFGGGSWRAHATFLSGFHADSEHLYDALLASKRRTLVHVLREKGYRTVAAEPGIKWYWPEGLFYGFDRIYDFEALDYRGPPIGWWKIPDQFTLYRIYQDEIRTAETPLFVKFSLIMTHIPYYPVPQYVPRWSRFDDGTAYDAELQSVAHDAYRDLMELSTWYIEAVGYEVDVLEGFLLDYVPENSLVIIVGDHQPPKLATHDNDSWAVPMHVLSRREDLVRAFDALGLEKGLVPRSPNALRMADFLPRFLEIFDGVRTD